MSTSQTLLELPTPFTAHEVSVFLRNHGLPSEETHISGHKSVSNIISVYVDNANCALISEASGVLEAKLISELVDGYWRNGTEIYNAALHNMLLLAMRAIKDGTAVDAYEMISVGFDLSYDKQNTPRKITTVEELEDAYLLYRCISKLGFESKGTVGRRETKMDGRTFSHPKIGNKYLEEFILQNPAMIDRIIDFVQDHPVTGRNKGDVEPLKAYLNGSTTKALVTGWL